MIKTQPMKILEERYHIIEEIGRGPHAVVYLIEDKRLMKKAAAKVIDVSLQLAHNANFVELLVKQLRVISRLHGRYIVPLYDMQLEENQLAIIMAYMPGGSLAKRLEQAAVSLEDALFVGHCIAYGLDSAHEMAISHGRLHPRNILFNENGEACLGDFSLPALYASNLATGYDQRLIIDVAPYLAPEIWSDPRESGAADQYGLACILVEMLTGQPLFTGETMAKIALQHFQQTTVDPQLRALDLPLGAVKVIRKGLSPNPEERFESCRQLMAAFYRAIVIGGLRLTEDKRLDEFYPRQSIVETGGGSAIFKGNQNSNLNPKDPSRENVPPPEPGVASTFPLNTAMRLDVATPSEVEVGKAFVIAASIRQLTSPHLHQQDLPRMRSGMLNMRWPWLRRSVGLRVSVSAPDCHINGPASQQIRLRRNADAPVIRFHLTPKTTGKISIIVAVLQEKEGVGSMHVYTTAVDHVAGEVTVTIESGPLRQGFLPHLREALSSNFGLGELRALCFDLGIDHETLSAKKGEFVFDLIRTCQRTGRLEQLLELCQEQRPQERWK